MKRYSWFLLLTATLVGQGCLSTDKPFGDRDLPAIKEVEKTPPPAPERPPVQPEDVTATNYVEKIQALNAELVVKEKEPVSQPVAVHMPEKP